MNPLEILQTLTPQELAIGSGVTFPIQLTKKTRRVWDDKTQSYVSKELTGWYPELGNLDLIKENLTSLLLYPLGFRIRQEYYGNNLEAAIEEPNTQALRFYIKHQIRALFATENRITYQGIQIKNLPEGIAVRVRYTLNSEVPIDDYLEMFVPTNS